MAPICATLEEGYAEHQVESGPALERLGGRGGEYQSGGLDTSSVEYEHYIHPVWSTSTRYIQCGVRAVSYSVLSLMNSKSYYYY